MLKLAIYGGDYHSGKSYQALSDAIAKGIAEALTVVVVTPDRFVLDIPHILDDLGRTLEDVKLLQLQGNVKDMTEAAAVELERNLPDEMVLLIDDSSSSDSQIRDLILRWLPRLRFVFLTVPGRVPGYNKKPYYPRGYQTSHFDVTYLLCERDRSDGSYHVRERSVSEALSLN